MAPPPPKTSSAWGASSLAFVHSVKGFALPVSTGRPFVQIECQFAELPLLMTPQAVKVLSLSALPNERTDSSGMVQKSAEFRLQGGQPACYMTYQYSWIFTPWLSLPWSPVIVGGARWAKWASTYKLLLICINIWLPDAENEASS